MHKVVWIIRFAVIQIFFGRNLRIQGYLGRPNYLRGLRRAKFGKYVRIFPNARIEVGPEGYLEIEDNVSIGPNVNITCFGTLRIGRGTTISANVFITDMDHDFSNASQSVMENSNIIRSTILHKNCFIGANSVVLGGSELGNAAVVGANSTVRGTFSENSILAGSPAKTIRKRK